MATFSPLPWRTTDLAALQERRAKLDVGTLAQEQHLAELDGGARLGVQFFDAQRGVFRDPVLLTTGGDDRVHEKIPEETRRPDERSRILLTSLPRVKPGPNRGFPFRDADLGPPAAAVRYRSPRPVRRLGCGTSSRPTPA